jgi:type II secretory pathway pseudopilin PulG
MIFFLKKDTLKRGMTSIELVVVFSIFAALATTVLFNYREFSTNIKLQNLTQDIALQIRQAQNRSVSGSYPNLAGAQTPPDTNWTPSYGLYFSTEEIMNDKFILFFDRNSSAVINPEPFTFGNRQILPSDIDCDSTDVNSECLDTIQITTGEKISAICLDEFTYGDCIPSDDIHIVFSRPLNRAYISYTDMTEDVFISDVSIYLTSPQGMTSVVRVTATGQIIVE